MKRNTQDRGMEQKWRVHLDRAVPEGCYAELTLS